MNVLNIQVTTLADELSSSTNRLQSSIKECEELHQSNQLLSQQVKEIKNEAMNLRDSVNDSVEWAHRVKQAEERLAAQEVLSLLQLPLPLLQPLLLPLLSATTC